MCISSKSWSLPDCPTSGYKYNCYGSYTWNNGTKYVGQFKKDERTR